ncbi:hypothetical protein GCK72_009027 [Caenorhabditis remanei]|uniref:DUF7774 domain-containing protein n=1 Tax=Caenorhabditis remanei TaxID=31234 RepID=A0A6A5H0I2_CAERE|nr:hypothetical protein GCK72_009027 [Caenorhabditis remanei]KAF1760777.1 hypothetical protein GCK72_009027 [Caenorhabditis remanei]
MYRSVHIFPTTSSIDCYDSKNRKPKKARAVEVRMDRYFKLRQTFSDYLDTRDGGSTQTPPTPIYYPPISTMTEDDKKRFTVKKITEEELEIFDLPTDHFSPVYFLEPEFELRWYNKPDALCGRFQRDCEAEAMSKMAQRLLALFIKMEMLESVAFKYDDIRAIRVYFMDDREMANDRLLTILDNIFSTSMIKLGQFSDKISVAVDYELRAFMSDQKKAKRLVLETMLKYPEFVPDSWGGESAILKWKDMKEADVRRREADAKDMIENEKKEREEKFKKEEEKVKNEEEKTKKEKERLEKEERIKKEVEEAERKKKEEKENRRKEVKKNREERRNADQTRKDKKEVGEEKTAFEKGIKDLLGGGNKKKKDEKKNKRKNKNTKTTENTKTKDFSHEEPPTPPPHQPVQHSPKTPPVPLPLGTQPLPLQPPQPLPSPHLPTSSNAPGQPRQHYQTPPRKRLSMAEVGHFLSGRKKKETTSAERVSSGNSMDHISKHPKGAGGGGGGGLFGRKHHKK